MAAKAKAAAEVTESVSAEAEVTAEVFAEPKTSPIAEARLAPSIVVSPLITGSTLTVGKQGVLWIEESVHGLTVKVEFRDHSQKTYRVPYAQIQSYRIEE